MDRGGKALINLPVTHTEGYKAENNTFREDRVYIGVTRILIVSALFADAFKTSKGDILSYEEPGMENIYMCIALDPTTLVKVYTRFEWLSKQES